MLKRVRRAGVIGFSEITCNMCEMSSSSGIVLCTLQWGLALQQIKLLDVRFSLQAVMIQAYAL